MKNKFHSDSFKISDKQLSNSGKCVGRTHCLKVLINFLLISSFFKVLIKSAFSRIPKILHVFISSVVLACKFDHGRSKTENFNFHADLMTQKLTQVRISCQQKNMPNRNFFFRCKEIYWHKMTKNKDNPKRLFNFISIKKNLF